MYTFSIIKATVKIIHIESGNKFARNLKFLRQQQFLSQSKSADELGISRARLMSYESGNTEPDLGTLIRISEKLDLSLEDLINKDLSFEKRKSGPEIQSTTFRKQLAERNKIMTLQLKYIESIAAFKKEKSINTYRLLDSVSRLFRLLLKSEKTLLNRTGNSS